MTVKYLLHFAHEHLTFRWPEFLALTSQNNCKFKLISDVDHVFTRPYIIIELENELMQENLIRSARASYLLKGLFELWAQSNKSVEDLAEQASKSAQFLSRHYAQPEQSFRVNCESFAAKLKQSTKVEWIRKMTFMETYSSRADLRNPKQIYCIFEMNDKKNANEPPMKEYYFGRQITSGDRAMIDHFSLKTRVFIANTSMDPMLSLIAANTAKVTHNDIVYDPFVGSGSLLVSAAYKGAYVLGTDIDWPLLHGKSRPSRKGERIRHKDENVRANLRQYNLENRYLDVMVSDITRSPLCDKLVIDSIISDPPYGVRECSEKIGSKKVRKPLSEDKVRYPAKTSYTIVELLVDLLSLSAKHLKIGGRLVYWLPVTKITDSDCQDFIPRHPCLRLVSFCEQQLAAKVSRVMVVMEKTRDTCADDKVDVPQIVNDMNFRETYFNKMDLR